MTVYKVETMLIFDKKSDAVAVGQGLINSLSNVRNLLMETSFIQLEECHHDETPLRSCVVLERREKS